MVTWTWTVTTTETAEVTVGNFGGSSGNMAIAAMATVTAMGDDCRFF